MTAPFIVEQAGRLNRFARGIACCVLPALALLACRAPTKPRDAAPEDSGSRAETASVATATAITKMQGDGQRVEAGTVAPAALTVKVVDRAGKPVRSVTITWSVVAGGGGIDPSATTTDAQGTASARWTVGTSAAESHQAVARVGLQGSESGLSAAFYAVAVAGSPAVIAKASGDRQVIDEGSPLPDSLVVRVADRYDNPIVGVPVNWSVAIGAGTLRPLPATTDIRGVSMVQWSLPASGSNTAQAAVAGLRPATFEVTVVPASPVGFISVSAGYFHTCGVSTTGAAYCWGDNGAGQLGNGTLAQSATATAVVGGHSFASVSAGVSQTCGVTVDRRTYCWGGPRGSVPVRIDAGVELVQVTVGLQHACGLAAGGAAYCWGDNYMGALGTGDQAERPTPTPVSGGLTYTSISSGWYYTCGVTPAGAGYCWGTGEALGSSAAVVCDHDYDGYPMMCATEPQAIDGSHAFKRVAAGERFTCGLTASGSAYCWGRYPGEGYSATPIAVPGAHAFTSLDVDAQRACGISGGGGAFCWGWIPMTNTSSDAPLRVGGDLTFTSVSTGWYHSCGVAAQGTAYCWGMNGAGELGDGSRLSSAVPVRVVARP